MLPSPSLTSDSSLLEYDPSLSLSPSNGFGAARSSFCTPPGLPRGLLPSPPPKVSRPPPLPPPPVPAPAGATLLSRVLPLPSVLTLRPHDDDEGRSYARDVARSPSIRDRNAPTRAARSIAVAETRDEGSTICLLSLTAFRVLYIPDPLVWSATLPKFSLQNDMPTLSTNRPTLSQARDRRT